MRKGYKVVYVLEDFNAFDFFMSFDSLFDY